ncbi:hypothetical protein VNI00_018105 [Paramarasmius palmivorus]|uniref:Uncharacterized protein n=1 Tax=Paramarasmius palmivorus TaxID=297713 RepID=A0AAW0B0Q4_9AGAR
MAEGSSSRKRRNDREDTLDAHSQRTGAAKSTNSSKIRRVTDPTTYRELIEAKKKLEEAKQAMSDMERHFHDEIEGMKEAREPTEELVNERVVRELTQQTELNNTLMATIQMLQNRVGELDQAYATYKRDFDAMNVQLCSWVDNGFPSEPTAAAGNMRALLMKVLEIQAESKDMVNEKVQLKNDLQKTSEALGNLEAIRQQESEKIDTLLQTIRDLRAEIEEMKVSSGASKDLAQEKVLPEEGPSDGERASAGSMAALEEERNAWHKEKAKQEDDYLRRVGKLEKEEDAWRKEKEELDADYTRRADVLEVERMAWDERMENLETLEQEKEEAQQNCVAAEERLETERNSWRALAADHQREMDKIKAELQELLQRGKIAQSPQEPFTVSDEERQRWQAEKAAMTAEYLRHVQLLEANSLKSKQASENEQRRLQELIESLKHDKHTLEATLEDYRRHLNALETSGQESRTQANNIEQELRERLAALEAEKKTWYTERTTLETEHPPREKMSQGSSAQEQGKKVEEELRERLAVLEEEKKTWDAEKIAFEGERQQRVESFEAEKQKIREESKSHADAAKALQDRLTALEQEKQTLQKEKASLEVEHQRLSESSQAEEIKWSTQTRAQEERERELQKRLAALAEEKTAWQTRKPTQEGEHKQRVETLEAEKEKIRAELKAQGDEVAKAFQERLAALEAEKQALQKEKTAWEGERQQKDQSRVESKIQADSAAKALQERLTVLTEEKHALQTEKMSLEAILKAHDIPLTDQDTQKRTDRQQRLQEHLAALEGEKNTWQKEKATLEGRVGALNAEKEKIKEESKAQADEAAKALQASQTSLLREHVKSLTAEKQALETEKTAQEGDHQRRIEALEAEKEKIKEDSKAQADEAAKERLASLTAEKQALETEKTAQEGDHQRRIEALEAEKEKIKEDSKAQADEAAKERLASLAAEKQLLETEKTAQEGDHQRRIEALEAEKEKIKEDSKAQADEAAKALQASQTSLLREHVASLTAEVSALNTEKMSWAQDASTMKEQLKEAQDNLIDAQMQLDALEGNLRTLEKKLAAEMEAKKGLEREIGQLRKEFSKAKDKLGELKDSNKTQKEAFQSAKSVYEDKIRELRSEVEQYEEAQCQLQVLRHELETSSQEVQRLQSDNLELVNKVASLQDVLSAVNTRELFEAELTALKGKVKTLQEQLTGAQKGWNDAKRTIRVQESEMQKLQAQKKVSDDHIKVLQAQLAQAASSTSTPMPAQTEDLQNMAKQVEDLKRQLDEERQANASLNKGKGRAFDVAAEFQKSRFGSRALREADIQDEINNAQRRAKYTLGKTIPTPKSSTTPMGPWNTATKRSPFQSKPGGQGSNGQTTPMDTGGTNHADDAESDRSKTLEQYKQLGAKEGDPVSPGLAKNAINKLAREILHEAFHVTYSTEIWLRPGVSPERLQQFQADPEAHPPKIHATWLDKTGVTPQSLRLSAWNKQLTFQLSLLAGDVVRQCPDKTMFGEGTIDWHSLFERRLGEVYVDICQGLPRDEYEERMPQLIMARVVREHAKKNVSNSHVSIRVAKHRSRLAIAGKMCRNRRENKNAEEREFFEHILMLTEHLGHNGMSDEESADEEVQSSSSTFKERRHLKHVLIVPWRHPSIRQLYQGLDGIPGVENSIFRQTGRTTKLPRVRVEQKSKREPPKGLDRSVFNPTYLNKLKDYEEHALKITNGSFALREFQLDNYRYEYDGSDVDDL